MKRSGRHQVKIHGHNVPRDLVSALYSRQSLKIHKTSMKIEHHYHLMSGEQYLEAPRCVHL